MGIWGSGLLQNDSALDVVEQRVDKLLSLMPSFTRNPGIESAAQLGAAVGLLLQCESAAFDVDSELHSDLLSAIKANKSFFAELPRKAKKALGLVAADRGRELSQEGASLPDELARAFCGFKPAPFFLMQYFFTTRHDALFRHAKVIELTQRLADELVDEIDEGFAAEKTGRIWEIQDVMALVALLLIIEPCRVEPGNFTRWRDQFRKEWDNFKPGNDEKWRTFLVEYQSCAELALQYGLWKHS